MLWFSVMLAFVLNRRFQGSIGEVLSSISFVRGFTSVF